MKEGTSTATPHAILLTSSTNFRSQAESGLVNTCAKQVIMSSWAVHMQATGFVLDIPRVEVLINSSRLSSKLKLDVKLLPIKAVLEIAPGTDKKVSLDI